MFCDYFEGHELSKISYKENSIIFFMPPAWKVRRWHLVIGLSVRPFVCLSFRPSVCP